VPRPAGKHVPPLYIVLLLFACTNPGSDRKRHTYRAGSTPGDVSPETFGRVYKQVQVRDQSSGSLLENAQHQPQSQVTASMLAGSLVTGIPHFQIKRLRFSRVFSFMRIFRS